MFSKTQFLASTGRQKIAQGATGSDRLVGIELGRILACLAVVFIHQQSSNYGSQAAVRESLDVMSRWAVPYFFIISGYFLPLGKGWTEVAAKYVVRLVPIFLFWVTAYAVYVGKPYWFLSDLPDLWKTLVTGGAGFHLWFLTSLGVCLILAAVILHYASVKILLLVALVLYVFGLMHGSYEPLRLGLAYEQIDRSFNPRNGPFMGLLFVGLGVALRQNLIAQSVATGVGLVLLGLALSAAETLFLSSSYASPVSRHDFLVGTLPFGLGVAMVFIGTTIQNPRIATAVRQVGGVSLGIYALHLAILWKVAGSLEPNSLASGLFTAALTLAIAIVGALIGARIPLIKRVFR